MSKRKGGIEQNALLPRHFYRHSRNCLCALVMRPPSFLVLCVGPLVRTHTQIKTTTPIDGSNLDARAKLHTPLHFQYEISQEGNAKPLIAVVQEIERRIRGVSSPRRLDDVMF